MQTIAFIPARGGSKAIPLKNIKLLAGKPLIYWNLVALEACEDIDKVVVSTDSEEIAKVATSYGLDKVQIHHRDPENAQDHSSTESVMMEYLNEARLESSDVFLLVQATSPFTRSIDFSSALQQYRVEECDSLLSVVANSRFFWSADGKPINYDPQNRARRQDYKGYFMENGAFYINNVGNIIKHKNRLSGRISLYEMPEYTGLELDEPDDWIVAEQLMKKHNYI